MPQLFDRKTQDEIVEYVHNNPWYYAKKRANQYFDPELNQLMQAGVEGVVYYEGRDPIEESKTIKVKYHLDLGKDYDYLYLGNYRSQLAMHDEFFHEVPTEYFVRNDRLYMRQPHIVNDYSDHKDTLDCFFEFYRTKHKCNHIDMGYPLMREPTIFHDIVIKNNTCYLIDPFTLLEYGIPDHVHKKTISYHFMRALITFPQMDKSDVDHALKLNQMYIDEMMKFYASEGY